HSGQRGEDHEKALIIAPPLPADREPGVGENPEEGVRGVLIRVAHVEPLAAGEAQHLATRLGLDVLAGAEVLRDEVQAGKPRVVLRLEHQVAVRVADPDGVERRPGEAAIERIVVARDGRVARVNLTVHEQAVAGVVATGTYDTRTPCSRSASSRIRSLSPWPAPRLRTSSGPGGNKRASSAADRAMSERDRTKLRYAPSEHSASQARTDRGNQ